MSNELPTGLKILVAHGWMGRGGSEATAMWTLQALQNRADVSFTTPAPMNLDFYNRLYGTSVSAEKVKVLPAAGLPWVGSGNRFVNWQRALFDRHCRKIAGHFDLCISAYNIVRFGRPAVQLIGDFSFSEKTRLLLYPNAEEQICHRQSLLRRAYLSMGELIRGGKRSSLAERGDCAVANSFWTAQQLDRVLGIREVPILYPPCLSPAENQGIDLSSRRRAPLGFVSLGRIAPEKELETSIGILDQVRDAGYPVTLDIIGGIGTDGYGEKIKRLVDERREWINTLGFLEPRAKAEIFATRTFAIHGCRVESFGIAVAEMASSGLIPFVPEEGGASEIVGDPDLTYSGKEEAVKKIIEVLEAPGRIEAIRSKLRQRSLSFRPQSFVESLLKIVGEFADKKLTGSVETEPRNHVAKNLATAH